MRCWFQRWWWGKDLRPAPAVAKPRPEVRRRQTNPEMRYSTWVSLRKWKERRMNSFKKE